jgi:hypothetical protein
VHPHLLSEESNDQEVVIDKGSNLKEEEEKVQISDIIIDDKAQAKLDSPLASSGKIEIVSTNSSTVIVEEETSPEGQKETDKNVKQI